VAITWQPLGSSPDSSLPSTVPNGRTKPLSAKLLTPSNKLAFLLQWTLMAERISGATDKRSEIKNGPIDRQAALAAHQVKCKRIQGSATNARGAGLGSEKAAQDTSHVHVNERLMKPVDGRHHRTGSVGTYAGQALQVAARAGQLAPMLLDDIGQVEECVGFLPPEAEGSQ
jgi:hypothetical protein